MSSSKWTELTVYRCPSGVLPCAVRWALIQPDSNGRFARTRTGTDGPKEVTVSWKLLQPEPGYLRKTQRPDIGLALVDLEVSRGGKR
jgi:hypothetical protein